MRLLCVLDNGLSVTARSTITSSCLNSCSAIQLIKVSYPWSSVLFVFASCTVTIGTGGELNGIIFLSAEKMPFTNLLIKNVPRRTETSRFWTVSIMTCMQLSAIRTCNAIVPTTLTFWSLTLFICGLWQMRLDCIQSCLTRSSHISPGPASVSKADFIGHIHDAVQPNLMEALYLLVLNKGTLSLSLKVQTSIDGSLKVPQLTTFVLPGRIRSSPFLLIDGNCSFPAFSGKVRSSPLFFWEKIPSSFSFLDGNSSSTVLYCGGIRSLPVLSVVGFRASTLFKDKGCSSPVLLFDGFGLSPFIFNNGLRVSLLSLLWRFLVTFFDICQILNVVFLFNCLIWFLFVFFIDGGFSSHLFVRDRFLPLPLCPVTLILIIFIINVGLRLSPLLLDVIWGPPCLVEDGIGMLFALHTGMISTSLILIVDEIRNSHLLLLGGSQTSSSRLTLHG